MNEAMMSHPSRGALVEMRAVSENNMNSTKVLLASS